MYYGGFDGQAYPKSHIAMAIGCSNPTIIRFIKQFESDEPEQALRLNAQKDKCYTHGRPVLCKNGDADTVVKRLIQKAKDRGLIKAEYVEKKNSKRDKKVVDESED